LPLSAPANTSYNARARLNQLCDDCVEAREGVGKNGDWCVDFHQRFDLDEAVRGCSLIEPLAPFFVEDPVRTEASQEDLPILRRMAKVPIAARQEWGTRLPPRRIYASGSVPSRCARRFS
jgi:galactonate dehydratase